MCLAIPLRIERFADATHVMAGDPGAEIRVDVSLVPRAQVGDYVIVHAGFAIGKVDEAEAALTLEAFAACGEGGDGPFGPGS